MRSFVPLIDGFQFGPARVHKKEPQAFQSPLSVARLLFLARYIAGIRGDMQHTIPEFLSRNIECFETAGGDGNARTLRRKLLGRFQAEST